MLTLTQSQIDNIKQVLFQHHGMLPVTIVQSMLSDYACTVDELLHALIPVATSFAIMPISHYSAGCVALGETGNIYVGANHEFSHLALQQTLHAEQSLVAVAHFHGETRLEKMATSANPCGHCRQFLYELAGGGDLQILVKDAPPTSLHKLLPHAFGPKDLQIEGGLLTPSEHTLFYVGDDNHLLALATQAAKRSYAPYTLAYAGAALHLRDGSLIMGSYLENVAFNPSLPAVQSALTCLVMSGYHYTDVISAAIAQAKDSVVNHVPSAQLVLAVACPDLTLQVALLEEVGFE